MAQTVPQLYDSEKDLCDSIEIFACGSNLFGQTESINEAECNIKVSAPKIVGDTLKQPNNTRETQILSKNSSAKETSRVGVCITWDRIVCQCGDAIDVRGNGRRSWKKPFLQKVVANGNVTCLVTDTGEMETIPHPETDSKQSTSHRAEPCERVKCVGCTDQRILFVQENKEKIIKEQSTYCTTELPAEVPCPLPVRELSCGKEHVLLLSTLGTVMSYGSGSRGQLGHGSTGSCAEPTIVDALNGLTMVSTATGGWHSAAISDIGDLYIWGWNESGQLGFPCDHNRSLSNQEKKQELVNILTVPTSLEMKQSRQNPCDGEADCISAREDDEELTVRKVACGSRHTVCLTECGRVFCFGWNAHGQLGLGDTVLRDSPAELRYFGRGMPHAGGPGAR